jgi:hypothetical protein
MTDSKCDHTQCEPGRLFCTECGKLLDRNTLRGIRLAGFVGVRHSTSPAIEEFWATGNPDNL